MLPLNLFIYLPKLFVTYFIIKIKGVIVVQPNLCYEIKMYSLKICGRKIPFA